jgi:hypothetical protein
MKKRKTTAVSGKVFWFVIAWQYHYFMSNSEDYQAVEKLVIRR